jgi:hypothetical protein
MTDKPLGTTRDLEISLTSPDKSVLRFGLASSFDPRIGGPNPRRFAEASLMFHGALEFGYRCQ